MILYDGVALASGPTAPNGELSAIGLDTYHRRPVGGIGFVRDGSGSTNGARIADLISILPASLSATSLNDFPLSDKDGLNEH